MSMGGQRSGMVSGLLVGIVMAWPLVGCSVVVGFTSALVLALVISISFFTSLSNASSSNESPQQELQHPACLLPLQQPVEPHPALKRILSEGDVSTKKRTCLGPHLQ